MPPADRVPVSESTALSMTLGSITLDSERTSESEWYSPWSFTVPSDRESAANCGDAGGESPSLGGLRGDDKLSGGGLRGDAGGEPMKSFALGENGPDGLVGPLGELSTSFILDGDKSDSVSSSLTESFEFEANGDLESLSVATQMRSVSNLRSALGASSFVAS
jgi:hypothetical protein